MQLEFLKSELFETVLAVSEQLEQTITDNAQLSVVQRIEGYLETTASASYFLSLPESVRSAETLASFKCKLKTYLFNISFNLAFIIY